jgi:hypothetical protein
VRPRGMREHRRFASVHLFAAVGPERDTGVALVLPEVSTTAMGLFLAELSRARSRLGPTPSWSSTGRDGTSART